MEKKQSPMDNILGGVAALIVGIIIVSLKDKSSSFYFGPDKSGITDVVGVLFIRCRGPHRCRSCAYDA